VPSPTVLPVATVNFTHDGPHTRVTEWKKLPEHGDAPFHSTLTYEEPCDYRDNGMERYYPVKDAGGMNRAIYDRYARATPAGMTFVGRCGMYAYLDMHQAVAVAISVVGSGSHDLNHTMGENKFRERQIS
jgi:UDP-galactopyranose mutase